MKLLSGLTVAVCLATPLFGSISVDMDFGALRDSSGGVISSTATLWAIIYDENGDNSLPGGLGIDESLVDADAAAAYAAFAGQTLAIDALIEGDRVLDFGVFNDPDALALINISETDFAGSGLVTGRSYGLYWFPSHSLATIPSAPFEIGGLNETTNFTGAIGTTIPNDGANLTGGVLDTSFGGGLGTVRFEAIDAIPEPSTALLALLGLSLLRRRR